MKVVGCLLLAVVCPVICVAATPDRRLADAAERGDQAGVRSLLRKRADVDGAQADGMTALIWAAHRGDGAVVDLLLRAGAKPNAATRYGVSALSEAALRADAAMVARLLKAGADVNLANPDGETPLMTASLSGSAEAVKLLLAKGAQVNAREKWEEQTALMWAVNEGHHEVTKLLIGAGADVNAVAHVSELTRHPVAVGSRIQATRIVGGLTPLMFAARQGDTESARLLLEAGAKLQHAEEDGLTPLFLTVNNGHFDTAAFLLERGADPNDGSLYIAVDLRNQVVTDFDHPPPKIHSKLGFLDLIELMLKKGADPNALTAKKAPARIVVNFFPEVPTYSAMQRAARSADHEVMRLFVKYGGDVKAVHQANAKPAGPPGFGAAPPGASLLLISLQGGGSPTEIYLGPVPTEMVYRIPEPGDKVEAAKLCLENGADVNVANSVDDTPLHAAAQQGLDGVVAMLVERGAKLDAKNKRGFTPLDLAMGKGGMGPPAPPKASTVELLKKLGATVTAEASKTPVGAK